MCHTWVSNTVLDVVGSVAGLVSLHIRWGCVGRTSFISVVEPGGVVSFSLFFETTGPGPGVEPL